MAIRERKDQEPVSALALQLAFFKRERQRFEVLVPNAYIDKWLECDIIGVRRSGYVDEVEVKISKSDFLADFKKQVWLREEDPGAELMVHRGHGGTIWGALKHDQLKSANGPINYFWFLAPKGVLVAADMPEHAGLMEYDPAWGHISVVKQAPLLHKRKADCAFRYHVVRNMPWRVWEYMSGKRS